VPDLRRRPHP